jgi:predicted Rossmann fold nucleotide-binding protein DprA/Smf involved in DNA uptake
MFPALTEAGIKPGPRFKFLGGKKYETRKRQTPTPLPGDSQDAPRKPGGVCVKELSNQYGVSVRSIQRDLNALDEAGWALREDHGYRRCTWRMVG